MILAAWVFSTLVWTTSALNITKPRAGDTIDISSPYNVTWTWNENDPLLIRMQITPSFEESSNIITAAGIATFWADGDIVSAQELVTASPVEIQLVNTDQYENVYAFVGPIYLINSLNISAVPSTYSTTIYPGTPLATPSASTAHNATSSMPTTTTLSIPTTSASASSSASASRAATLSGSAIAGIVIGVLAAVSLVAAGVFLNRRRPQNNRPRRDSHNGGQWVKPETSREDQVYDMHGSRNVGRRGPQELDSQP